MAKSKIIEDNTESVASFRAGNLVISKETRTVVLVTGKENGDELFTGTVIYQGSYSPVGHSSDNWVICGFVNFKGKLEIQN